MPKFRRGLPVIAIEHTRIVSSIKSAVLDKPRAERQRGKYGGTTIFRPLHTMCM